MPLAKRVRRGIEGHPGAKHPHEGQALSLQMSRQRDLCDCRLSDRELHRYCISCIYCRVYVHF